VADRPGSGASSVFLNRATLAGQLQIIQARWMLLIVGIVACALAFVLHGSPIWLRVIAAVAGGLIGTVVYDPAQNISAPVKYAPAIGSIATLLGIIVIIAFAALGSPGMSVGLVTLSVPFVCGLVLFVALIISDRMRTIVRDHSE